MVHTRWFTTGITAAVILIIVILLGSLLNAIYSDLSLAQRSMPMSSQVAAGELNHRPAAIGAVLQANLMGRQESTASQESRTESDPDTPETRMDLTLKGVFVSTVSSDSGALIEGQKGGARYYAVGDSLPEGAELYSVHRDHVQLRRNGRNERLSLKMAPSAAADGTGAEVAGPLIINVPAEPDSGAAAARRAQSQQQQQRVESLRERLRQLRQASAEQVEEQD